ncbi:KipI antagonist [Lentibacillus sp. JNUCC-1]|nr:KipI antagonist [Lentibacillus sp. JNUCC-1]
MKKNDVILVKSHTYTSKKISGRRVPSDLIPVYSTQVSARVVLGPQSNAFTNDGLATFLNSWYTVSPQSDRMACRLEGPEIHHKSGADIASEGMFWGAVQVPENGLPILFQVGRSSVGGYTKIAGVIAVDLPLIAQLKPGDYIRFEEVSLQEAHDSYTRQEGMFHCLTLA